MKKTMKSVGCFLEHNGKILIIFRIPNNRDGGCWAIPAGEIDPGESAIEAIIREVKEETGHLCNSDQLELLGTYFWKLSEFDLEFTVFRTQLNERMPVQLNPREHSDYKWINPKECYSMNNLIRGFHELLEKTRYVK